MNTNNLSRLGKWVAAGALAMSLAWSAAAPVMAQEISPELLTLSRKFVDLSNKAGVYEAILAQTAAQTSKLLSSQNPEITDKIDKAIEDTLDQYKGKNDELFNQFARVYATTFTEDEMKQIVAFYETPVGQKLASTAFDVNRGIGAVMQVYTYNFGTDFVRKVRATLQAQGYKL